MTSEPKSHTLILISLGAVALVAAGIGGFLLARTSMAAPVIPQMPVSAQNSSTLPEDEPTADAQADVDIGSSDSRAIGVWHFREMIDDFTDKKAVGAFLGESEGKGMLMVKCDEPGAVYVMLKSNEFIGEGKSGVRDVLIRLDKSPAKQQLWAHGDNFAGIFEDGSAHQFMTSLLGVEQVAVRIRDYKLVDQDFVFEISTGTDEMLEALSKGCAVAPFRSVNE